MTIHLKQIACLILPVLLCSAADKAAGADHGEMPAIELTRLAEFPPPSQSAYVQGGTVTSTGLLMAFTCPEEANPLLMLDTETWQPVLSKTEDLSHANDLCYVSGEIYVLPMDAPQIVVLEEETLSVKRTIDTPQTYHAIGYDEEQNRFAAIYSEGKGAAKRLICDILDPSCSKVLSSFPADTNLVYQGLAVHDGKVYYSCWKRGEGKRDHKTVYDDLLKINDNVIYVYDFEGNLIDAMLIRKPEGYTTFEIETVSFLGDQMILLFNENLADEDNTLMTGVYGQAAECRNGLYVSVEPEGNDRSL